MDMKKYITLCVLFYFSTITLLNAQGQAFSRADSLRGALNSARSCYDVNAYVLDLEFKTLVGLEQRGGRPPVYPMQGAVEFQVTNRADYTRLQFDLFAHWQVDSVVWQGQHLSFEREFNAVYLYFPQRQAAGDRTAFRVYYQGNPIIAKRAPWDGGFVFTTDEESSPWIGVACEGFGASSWWPCKDHLSDEPDSLLLRFTIPESGLWAVGNGKFIERYTKDGKETFVWKVSNPINTYNVTVNVGDYIWFTDNYQNSAGEWQQLNYFVLSYQLEKAIKHFEQVPPMLACFENVFGPYAFWEDGYKLVETPYWGMEHQSAVAYGNNYNNNKEGFDFIIVHESGHEWWGNSVSVADHADMWIHEGFTTYSETLYLECLGDTAKASNYLQKQRKSILNKQPMVGPYDVNFTDNDNDVYYKGAWLLHTMRNSMGDDARFYQMLAACYQHFFKRVTNTAEMVDFWCAALGADYRAAWMHYLFAAHLPALEWRIETLEGEELVYSYRYADVLPGFSLPLILLDGQKINPITEWQSIRSDSFMALWEELPDRYLLDVRQIRE